jgi:ATP-dependent Clp protease ATP-binding subunit ClpA
MVAVDLRSLIGKMNDTCRRSLEAAAGFTLSRSHYNVEVEHWLLKLLDVQDSDFVLIMRHFEIDPGRVAAELTRVLDRLKTGNTRAPSLLPEVVTMAREAWLIASLDDGAPRIRSGHLLVALLSDEGLARVARESSPQLAQISAEALRKNLAAICRDSTAEAPAEIPAGSAPSGAAPRGGAPSPALDQYTIDLTERARAGTIDPVLGRDAEIRQVVDILMRRRQNNPILTGEAGVGKTAVVEGLALAIVKEQVPPPLRSVVVRTLDLGLLQGGAGVKGEFENRLKSVIEEVRASPRPVILFIDEAHTMIGAGGQPGPMIADLARHIETLNGDLAVLEREQATGLDHRSELDDLAAEKAAAEAHLSELEARWQRERALSEEIDGLRARLGEPATAEPIDDSMRPRWRDRLATLEKELKELQGEAPLLFTQVDGQAVAEVVAGWTGIPVGRMVGDEIRAVLGLRKKLAERVIGQPQALRAVAEAIQTSRAQLTDPRKPIGVFLMVGTSGVGKTETALALAETLYGGEQKLTVLNMSEFKEEHKVSMLLGAPPGYVGYGEGGVLTRRCGAVPIAWSCSTR